MHVSFEHSGADDPANMKALPPSILTQYLTALPRSPPDAMTRHTSDDRLPARPRILITMKLPFLHRTSSLIVALTLAAFTAGSSQAADTNLKRADKNFVETAYQGGLAEVKMGELALGKTANADVKAFAEHMVTDHGKANGELKALADSKKVAVASEPSMTAKAKSKLADAKSGADFDKAYAKAMVSDHKDTVALFEKAANEANDPEVKAFASKTLPTLKMHLTMAEELQGKVGK